MYEIIFTKLTFLFVWWAQSNIGMRNNNDWEYDTLINKFMPRLCHKDDFTSREMKFSSMQQISQMVSFSHKHLIPITVKRISNINGAILRWEAWETKYNHTFWLELYRLFESNLIEEVKTDPDNPLIIKTQDNLELLYRLINSLEAKAFKVILPIIS